MVLVLTGGSSPARGQGGGAEIDAKPVAGQFDVLQKTAIQLGGKPGKGGPQPSSYLWEIVGGEGGTLLKADQPEAIFQAPAIEQDLMLFVIQLTVEYPVQKASRATLHIRVHRELGEQTIEQKMAELYEKEEARRQERNKNRSRSTVVHSVYPSWHHGYSWGWGRPIYYPVYVPIILPPPGIDWGPGDGVWVEPAPLPFDELVTEFPRETPGSPTAGSPVDPTRWSGSSFRSTGWVRWTTGRPAGAF
jgi:hypothetical protein